MEKKSKRLVINGKSYILDLTQCPDASWECRVSESGKEIVQRIRKIAPEHEVKFLGHVIAYDIEGIRRDKECDEECESGWEQHATAPRS
jgi:hypothetical protein